MSPIQHRIVIDVRQRVLNMAVPNLKVSVSDEVVDKIIVTFLQSMLVNKIEDSIKEVYVHPDGLWQTIKAKLGLRYREKQVPVRIEVYHVCPHVQIDDNTQHVEYVMNWDPHDKSVC